MASITKESFVLHKLHSLTGIVPVGFYMVQHLFLNSFSLVGADKYNSVSAFFYGMPEHILLGIEVLVIWIPLMFHAVYGLMITSRAEPNSSYKTVHNRMYLLQRYSGLFIFVFLIYHVLTTSIRVKLAGTPSVVDYGNMAAILSSYNYAILLFYVLGVVAASYHLSYGVWNFCIRWGITISARAQDRILKFSSWMFVIVTLLGWAALAGFFLHRAPPIAV